MADSPLPAVALSPCDVEEKKSAKVAAVSSPASPPFGLRAAVTAAIATFPERRRGLKDVSNALAPAKSPPRAAPAPPPVRAVGTRSSRLDLRVLGDGLGHAAAHGARHRADDAENARRPPAAPLLMTPPPRTPKLDAPFSELGKFPELAPAAPPAPARRIPVTLAALVAFVALGAAVGHGAAARGARRAGRGARRDAEGHRPPGADRRAQAGAEGRPAPPKPAAPKAKAPGDAEEAGVQAGRAEGEGAEGDAEEAGDQSPRRRRRRRSP